MATKIQTQLIIAEKPSVAGKLAAALGTTPKQNSKGGVSYYEVERDGKRILIASAVGHVYTLVQSEKGSSYPQFKIEWDESAKSSKGAEFTKKYLDVLKKLAKEADEVIGACDYDVEGSLIAGNVIRFAAKGKPAKRMLFSTLTKEDLVEAYENAGPLDVESIEAGDTRHRLDWLWGINVSRALMSAIRAAGTYRVMSIGRVQGPTLDMLSEREKSIKAFVPQPYWQIFANAKGVQFTHAKDKFFDMNESEKALRKCAPEKHGTVEKVESRKFRQLQPVPFDLTTLQVEAYRNFGISPSHTLEIAQKLYEAAVISYPRSSSQKLPEKLNLKGIIQQLQQQAPFAHLARQLIEAKRFKPFEGSKSDSAHVAIYPTGQVPPKMSVEEGKLYDLIVKRFLAVFAPEAKRETMNVGMAIGGEDFKASGTRTIEKGWFAFYEPYVHLEEETLPPFAEGERVPVEKVWREQKETQPPKRFTPASLVKEMERQSLGTKATRSTIIDTLFNRNYLADKKSIKVTDFGLEVHTALKENAPEILSEKLTRQFEEEVELIQEGKRKGFDVVKEGEAALKTMLDDFKGKEKTIGTALLKGLRSHETIASTLGKCPKCPAGMLKIRKSKFGFFVGCGAYPECKNLYSLPKNAKIEPLGTLCKECKTPEIKVIRAKRRPFKMCLTPTCPTKATWGKKPDGKPGEPEEKEGQGEKGEPGGKDEAQEEGDSSEEGELQGG